ncbi:hypothetical protein C0991_006939 [Blastosporella zonata]|nr:hypothetical protein C0991_006939 [Blastosporella zonata]
MCVFVLAATDHLRKKTIALEARMHSLEDALAIIHASASDGPHPLLNIPTEHDEDEQEEPALKPVAEEHVASALSESLGSLHIDRKGTARFFGPSGGSESLLLSAQGLESNVTPKPLPELDDAYLPEGINICYQSFPFTPSGILLATVQPMIEAFLPPIERAIYLCETFMEHLTWMFQIVTRQQVIKELIPAIYKQSRVSYGPHDLALMLIVLGIGTLVDLNLSPYSLEAQHYYRLSRAALALQPVLGQQSIVTIKVLHLTSIYHGMSGKESNLEQSYALLDLASQVALKIGFHVDPSLWGFTGKEAYDRRVYFWNLMAGVLWQSLVTGRPPSLLMSYIDCHLPTAADEALFQKDEVPLGFGIWGFQVSVECLIPIVKTTLAVKPPSYQDIMDLDRKVRAFVKTNDTGAFSADTRTATSMAAFARSHYQALLLMFLHRGFFAQAMSDNALDPLKSPYGESVLAAYTSACVVLEDTKSQYSKRPHLLSRVWRVWSLAFSAAVIVGTVAIRGMHLDLQPPAFKEFESACIVFRDAAETSSRAARAMPILQVMLEKAFQARERYRQRQKPVLPEARPDDELSIFGGRTRLVSTHPVITSLIAAANGGCSSSESPPQTSSQANPPIAPSDDDLQNQRHSHNNAFYTTQRQTNQRSPRATFADLSGGWDGLFHEVPRPSRGVPPQGTMNSPYPALESGDAAMLDDRWSSFMHSYNILEDPTQYHHPMR